MKFGTPVKQSQPFNRDYFHDNWCPICYFMEFWICWKKDVVTNFGKIRAIVLKLHTNILHQSRNFVIEFCQNRLKRSNFFRFWIFWEFFQNCLTQANFDLSSWNLWVNARDVPGSETFRTVRCPVWNTSIRTCSNSRIVRTVWTVRTVLTVQTVRTIQTSCLRSLRSTYHGSHRLTRDAWFLYVWPDFLNTSLTRYFKRRD